MLNIGLSIKVRQSAAPRGGLQLAVLAVNVNCFKSTLSLRLPLTVDAVLPCKTEPPDRVAWHALNRLCFLNAQTGYYHNILSMTFPKQRLEAFTDGVVAIIITIMVMSIPLPETFESDQIWKFLRSIFIYLLSFIVVGAFWRHHHRIFLYINNVGNNLISSNFLFLFFLSLIPIFTKWVIEQPGALMPVIGYDVVFILVYMCYNFIFHYVIKTSEHEEIQHIKKLMEGHRTPPPKQSWIPFLIATFVIVALITGLIFLAISHTRFATIVLLGIPVASSLLNLFFEDFKPERNGKHRNFTSRTHQS